MPFEEKVSKATLTTDGDNLTTVLEARTGISEDAPLFRVESKTERGDKALAAFHRDGSPFTLSSDDISLKPLVSLPIISDEFDSITAFSAPEQRPTSLFIYPGDVENELPPVYVTLKTVRYGEEVGVRSNEEQSEYPIVIELEYPIGNNPDGDSPEFHVSIWPHFEGCTVKNALKGLSFLRNLPKRKGLACAIQAAIPTIPYTACSRT